MCLAIGLWIHHDPDGANAQDAANRARRRQNTVDLYKARFGPDMDARVWDMGLELPKLPSAAANKTGLELSDRINLRLRDITGSEMEFNVRSSAPFDKIVKAYADKKGAMMEDFRFDFDGTLLWKGEWKDRESRTVNDLELVHGDVIEVSASQVGC
ncbi:hypothetical protein BCR44DRAFT_45268 [Catenaria anguillulae PL171]|uniref:Ubiquitin-like domain-containing protein n=1 Tax=Catenaria anguillulae PL171 TaxID=765915 RepID=A0A1Y2H8W1_9FUNG|nr:hypothetical protein BCR44DRAFT_45268 [Catenaria anguillulae PL171]